MTIDKIVKTAEKINRKNAECTTLFFILGHFGDRLPEEIKTEIRNMANEAREDEDRMYKMVGLDR